jgi:ABC-type bacteriocin/lantibiotic exporter with double-glycine peptidase domain
MALTAYFIAARPGGISTGLPVLAAIGLGGQRLLPVMQLIFSSLVTIRGNRESLSDIITLLEQPIPNDAMLPDPPMLPFERQIEMRGVGFRYQPQGPFVLRHVSLTLRKGERVGIVGRTGGGKSTLLDILMGLLDPTEGQLAVDNAVVDPLLRRAWQARIAHVPQHIFLTDGTIAENIALATAASGIDPQRVTAAAQLAGIAGDISTMPAGYLTQVGERGAKLSGGQRQRIGIARALYKEADVIVLDEATSALDHETEKAVMSAIEGLDQKVTLIIVAHRQSTLAACDAVYEVVDGTLIRKGGDEPATALPRRV